MRMIVQWPVVLLLYRNSKIGGKMLVKFRKLLKYSISPRMEGGGEKRFGGYLIKFTKGFNILFANFK